MSEVYCLILLSLVVRIRCLMEGFIVGGQPAPITQFSHSVYLYVMLKKHDTAWSCGASIINQDIILTAAHCIYDSADNPMRRIDISAGSEIKNQGQKTTAMHYIRHEHYNDDTNENDIALIKIRTKFLLNAKTSRVALMLRPPPIQSAQVAGWGLIDDVNWLPAQELQYTTQSQTIWTRAKCENEYGSIPRNTICAQGNKRQYVASGDSGSALVINGYIQIGIVSFKRPLLSKTLIVYTNVSSYIVWITNKAKFLHCGHY